MPEMDRDKLGELLTAYLDGELDPRESDTVKRLLEHDDDARQLFEELRETASLVSSLPRHAAPDSIAEEIRLHLERSDLLGDSEPTLPPREDRRRAIPALASLAAAIGLSMAGAWWMTRDQGGRSSPAIGRVAMAPEKEHPEETLRAQPAPKERRAKTKAGRRSERKGSGEYSKSPAKHRSIGKKKRKLKYSADAAGDTPATAAPSAATARKRALGNLTEMRLADNANLDQKISAGVDSNAIRDHDFSNEPLRLRLVFGDEKQLNATAARLSKYLAARDIADLSSSEWSPRKAEAARRGFYVSGKPGVNFKDGRQKQILVRLPLRDLDEIMGELEGEGDIGKKATLAAGPIEVRGLGEARELLGFRRTAAMKSKHEQVRSERPAVGDFQSSDDSAGENPDPGRRFFLELARAFGLDYVRPLRRSATPTQTERAVDVSRNGEDARIGKSAGPARPAGTEVATGGVVIHDSLVERRVRAARGKAQGGSSPPGEEVGSVDLSGGGRSKGSNAPGPRSPADTAREDLQLVTLVIELSVSDQPEKSEPGASAGSAPKKAKKRVKPPPRRKTGPRPGK